MDSVVNGLVDLWDWSWAGSLHGGWSSRSSSRAHSGVTMQMTGQVGRRSGRRPRVCFTPGRNARCAGISGARAKAGQIKVLAANPIYSLVLHGWAQDSVSGGVSQPCRERARRGGDGGKDGGKSQRGRLLTARRHGHARGGQTPPLSGGTERRREGGGAADRKSVV